MADWSNSSKNTSTFSNQQLNAGNNMTWDEAVFPWDEADNRTWNVPKTAFTRQTKNTSVFSNATKN